MYVDCWRRGKTELVGTSMLVRMLIPDVWEEKKEGCPGSKDKRWAGTSLNVYSIADAVF